MPSSTILQSNCPRGGQKLDFETECDESSPPPRLRRPYSRRRGPSVPKKGGRTVKRTPRRDRQGDGDKGNKKRGGGG